MPKIDPRIEAKITELRQQAKKALSLKQFEEALGHLETAIDLHATSYKLYRLRSIALSCLQDYERAAADADKVIELAPHVMDGYYHKGFAYFHLRRYAEAAHAFQLGLKLNPTDRTLRQGFWDAITLVSQSRTDSGDAAGAHAGGDDRHGGGRAALPQSSSPRKLRPANAPSPQGPFMGNAISRNARGYLQNAADSESAAGSVPGSGAPSPDPRAKVDIEKLREIVDLDALVDEAPLAQEKEA